MNFIDKCLKPIGKKREYGFLCWTDVIILLYCISYGILFKNISKLNNLIY